MNSAKIGDEIWICNYMDVMRLATIVATNGKNRVRVHFIGTSHKQWVRRDHPGAVIAIH